VHRGWNNPQNLSAGGGHWGYGSSDTFPVPGMRPSRFCRSPAAPSDHAGFSRWGGDDHPAQIAGDMLPSVQQTLGVVAVPPNCVNPSHTRATSSRSFF
jgi:hypothetical protein